MRFLASFIKSMILVEASALAGLLLAGLILTMAQGDQHHGRGFFSYRVAHLDQTPAWFVAALALSALNGFWLFRLALLEGSVGTPPQGPWGQYNAALPLNPLRLFSVNLIAIPAFIGLFIVARSMNF